MCGIAGMYNVPDASRSMFTCLLLHQHRGQDSSGVTFTDGKKFLGGISHTALGMVAEHKATWPLPKEKILVGVGQVRYGTAGARASLENAQPFLVQTDLGPFSIGHNGDTPGFEQLRTKLEAQGAVFSSTADTEVIAQSIAVQAKTAGTMQEAMRDTLSALRGAYALVMSTPSALVGCRDPWGYRPLSLGRLGEGWILASETAAFKVLGAEYVRDVEPGEMVWIDENGLKSISIRKPYSHLQQCSFESIYFAYPSSTVFGRHVDGLRKSLGEELARELQGKLNHENVTFVPVLSSGMYAADGFAKAWGVHLDHALVRNQYADRAFITPGQHAREEMVQRKFSFIPHRIEGKWVVLIDDSIVRGGTSHEVVHMARDDGAIGVSLLSASPPILNPCRAGVDMKDPKELLARVKQGNMSEMREFIGADELFYLSYAGLRRVMGSEGFKASDFCLACFDGKYAL